MAGGWTNGRLSNRLYVYDPGTDTWTRKADMPFTIDRRAGHQGMINGKLYVYAGATVNADGSAGPHRFFRYDPATNRWTTLARPSYARRGGASAAGDPSVGAVGDVWLAHPLPCDVRHRRVPRCHLLPPSRGAV